MLCPYLVLFCPLILLSVGNNGVSINKKAYAWHMYSEDVCVYSACVREDLLTMIGEDMGYIRYMGCIRCSVIA